VNRSAFFRLHRGGRAIFLKLSGKKKRPKKKEKQGKGAQRPGDGGLPLEFRPGKQRKEKRKAGKTKKEKKKKTSRLNPAECSGRQNLHYQKTEKMSKVGSGKQQKRSEYKRGQSRKAKKKS